MARFNFDLKKLFGVLLVVIFLFWGFGQIFTIDQGINSAGEAITELNLREGININQVTYNAVKIIIILGAVYLGGLIVASIAGKGLNRRDFLALVILAVVIWLVWDKIGLGNIFRAGSWDAITFSVVSALTP